MLTKKTETIPPKTKLMARPQHEMVSAVLKFRIK